MRGGQNQYALLVPMLSQRRSHKKRVTDLAQLWLFEMNKHESEGAVPWHACCSHQRVQNDVESSFFLPGLVTV